MKKGCRTSSGKRENEKTEGGRSKKDGITEKGC
jgi:hypothetical protein